MKTFNWDYGFEGFLDKSMAGKTFYDVHVGSGRPQRIYPETDGEVSECRENVAASPINPGLGELTPARVR